MIGIDYIEVDKDLIPYSFDITLDNETFTFEINYNSLYDFFTINLLKNDEIIVLAEKLIYGKPLFISAMHKEIPYVTILPYDASEKTERITFENFNESVFLYLVGD